MKFHVVSLPHTQTTKAFSSCAFTEKVRKFCNMMSALGHEVILYAGEENEATVTELVTVISEEERVAFLNGEFYVNADFNPLLPTWQKFNGKVVEEIKKRAGEQDFVCLIGGTSHKPIADALPAMMCVEFGIGYGGTFSPYRVFESYAWMHTVYGSSNPNPNALDGNWFDTVIPNYFEVEDFPFQEEKEDYYLYIGRLTDRKGFQIAADVCERLGKRLILAGPGEPPTYGEYVGVVGPEKRAELMGGARAVFVPTQYIEPFGSVAVEAMLCGTPIITTDWGAFTETNIYGVTGFRCRTFKEFLEAVGMVEDLDKKQIRDIAVSRYSLETVGRMYETYFTRLLTLWGDGWYNTK
jgi:glycosyltransferase involved in cell wall biosynthesis